MRARIDQLLLEVVVEAIQQVRPLLLPILHRVQLAFEPRRVLRVEDVREVLHQQPRHHRPNLGRHKLRPDLLHIVAVLDRIDNRRIRRRPPNPLLFEHLHQTRFVVPWRRLGRLPLRVQPLQPQRLPRGQLRQPPVFRLRVRSARSRPVRIVTLPSTFFHCLPRQLLRRGLLFLPRLLLRGGPRPLVLFLELQKPFKLQHAPAHPEVIRVLRRRRHIHRRLVEDRRRHLARHKPLPDQPVQPELLIREMLPDRLWRELHRRRPNRLMRVLRLRLLLARILVRLSRQVRPAQLADKLSRLGDRIRAHPRRVRPHVRDQAHRAFAADLHAFIQPLRHAHRSAHVEAHPARSILLQLARRIRSLRVAPAFLFLDAPHRPRRALKLRQHLVHRVLVRQRVREKLLLAFLVEAVRHPDRLTLDPDHPRRKLLRALTTASIQQRV